MNDTPAPLTLDEFQKEMRSIVDTFKERTMALMARAMDSKLEEQAVASIAYIEMVRLER